MGYQPRQTPEKALANAERPADALLFQADEGFARSLGIDLTPLELGISPHRSPDEELVT